MDTVLITLPSADGIMQITQNPTPTNRAIELFGSRFQEQAGRELTPAELAVQIHDDLRYVCDLAEVDFTVHSLGELRDMIDRLLQLSTITGVEPERFDVLIDLVYTDVVHGIPV